MPPWCMCILVRVCGILTHLVEFPVGVHSEGFAASSDALDLSDKKAVAVRELRIASESLVLLVLGEKLVEILLVGHAWGLVLRDVFDAL